MCSLDNRLELSLWRLPYNFLICFKIFLLILDFWDSLNLYPRVSLELVTTTLACECWSYKHKPLDTANSSSHNIFIFHSAFQVNENCSAEYCIQLPYDFSYWVFLFNYYSGSHVCLKLTMWLRLALWCRSSCLCYPNVGAYRTIPIVFVIVLYYFYYSLWAKLTFM